MLGSSERRRFFPYRIALRFSRATLFALGQFQRAKVMVQRQYFNLPIGELEHIFDDKRHSHDVLTGLITELSHRKVPRAKKLQKRVLQALSVEKTKPMPSANWRPRVRKPPNFF
jgi:hypothetical protein